MFEKYNLEKFKENIYKIRNDAYPSYECYHHVRWETVKKSPSNEELLEKMSIEEIEKFLRKKKLERISK